MQAASLDVEKAYRNSPILPAHKRYLCVYWKGSVYVQHVAVKGLATAGGIQGCVADATLDLLKFHKLEPAVKWVDNFIFFRFPLTLTCASPSAPSFSFNLSSILTITKPLGISWHPLSRKG